MKKLYIGQSTVIGETLIEADENGIAQVDDDLAEQIAADYEPFYIIDESPKKGKRKQEIVTDEQPVADTATPLQPTADTASAEPATETEQGK